MPFPVPDDPYLKLTGEGLEDVFKEQVLLPRMMTKLSQGAGRLIRISVTTD
ncbi:helicase C-terminal domain-containing protein [Paenibacillus sp. LX16]|uniref:helicase C-terminal domain-containing protein n=1 Tax=Paenibacillus sp. LX16 TaxID=1740264 RepID=UPI003FA795C2